MERKSSNAKSYIPIFIGKSPVYKLSKKHFGRIAAFHSKKLLGETPKNLKKSLGKSIQTKNHTSFYWENPYKKKHGKTFWQNRYFLFKKSLWESSNRYWKVFVQNHPKKTHTNFSLGKRTKKQEEKTFGKTSILLAKKSLKKYPKAYTHTFPIFCFYTHILFPYPLCSPPCLVRREVYYMATRLELFFSSKKKREKREWKKKRSREKKEKEPGKGVVMGERCALSWRKFPANPICIKKRFKGGFKRKVQKRDFGQNHH